MSRNIKWYVHVHPKKTQISMHFRAVSSDFCYPHESFLHSFTIQNARSEDFDQIARMFAEHLKLHCAHMSEGMLPTLRLIYICQNNIIINLIRPSLLGLNLITLHCYKYVMAKILTF